MGEAAREHSGRLARLWEAAHAPVSPGSLVAFRVLFGLLAFVGAVRFLANGWVERFFERPRFFFHYWGFEWVEVLSPAAMQAAFVALAVLGLMIAAGLFYRVAIVAYFLLFTYVELIDVTNYLNHYYLVSLLAFWMALMPLGRVRGLDGRLFGGARRTLPRWMVWALRLQVGVVYFYAGLAKLTGDWLLHAQPLGIWLGSRGEAPLIGALVQHEWAPLVMSWAGFLYDTTIPFWLSWRRTRGPAYGLLLVFHLCTHLLFTIGMFPLIMSAAATVFFAPDWPRRFAKRFMKRFHERASKGDAEGAAAAGAGSGRAPAMSPARLALAGGLVLVAAVQVLAPLRAHAYGGDVLWHEQGMRWSWRVMCREKDGSVLYRVRVPGRRRELRVPPSRYLTPHQEREMSGQPDLILQLAHHIRDEYVVRHGEGVEVRVDALASLNGRPMARLIDPEVDLATVEDGLAPAEWILPGPDEAPVRWAHGESR